MNNTTDANCLFPVSDIEKIKQQMLNWVKPFSIFCLLDSQQYSDAHHSVDYMLAVGAKRVVPIKDGGSLDELQRMITEKPSWLFGHLAYDLKNEVAPLVSRHTDGIGFPDLFFFEPEILIRIQDGQLLIEAEDAGAVYAAICSMPAEAGAGVSEVPEIRSRLSRDEYLEKIETLRKHILRGDCYEINYCQEFFAEGAVVDPVVLYQALSSSSPNPFSGLYRMADRYLVCASPERFIRKEGQRILSQPIKGTARRVPGDAAMDQLNESTLYHSTKDRSENVMVVDMVRNDLSRVCVPGSVVVDELCQVYAFPQVYQMISTIRGDLEESATFKDIIRALFPMGSMTGAPKRKVMELIERYERRKRGIFSGALGYLAPDGDFDFNVVIRSIMYNAITGYLSFQAGSAITWHSEAASEWDECQLKAEAIRKVLDQ